MIKDLPKKLQSLRLQYNFSQKQVAEMLHVSPSIISGYETGERTPSTENLLALSYLYHCSTDYLLGKQADHTPHEIDVSGLNDQQVKAIIGLVESLRNK